VEVDMNGAAVGDLVVTVQPFDSSGTAVMPGALVPVAQPTPNPAFAGGKVTFWGNFDVSPYEQVRVRIQNNNAGAQTINRASWRLAAGG
jgi:hypothetical protein